jgi:Ca-activated chloride channel family protein
VTALYEIVPADAPEAVKAAATPGQQPLKYSAPTATASGEWLTFRMRYQQPQGEGTAVEKSLALSERPKAGANWEWASAVAEFGLCLRDSKYAPKASLAQVIQRAQKALGKDADGARAEFLLMVHRAAELSRK